MWMDLQIDLHTELVCVLLVCHAKYFKIKIPFPKSKFCPNWSFVSQNFPLSDVKLNQIQTLQNTCFRYAKSWMSLVSINLYSLSLSLSFSLFVGTLWCTFHLVWNSFMKSSHHEDWQELWVLLLKQSEFFPSDESIAIKVKLMKPFLHLLSSKLHPPTHPKCKKLLLQPLHPIE